jgi:transcriptional regulator with XRE-family HTH domain
MFDMPRSRNSRYDSDYRWIIGRLAELRNEKGISQDVVAKSMRTSQSMVSKMEKGVVRLDLADLLSFLSALDADPLDFVREYLRIRRKQ